MSNYDFEIQYIKGKDNSAADALSRYPEYNYLEILIENQNMFEFNTLNTSQTLSTIVPNLNLKSQIIAGYQQDQVYRLIYNTFKNKTRIPVSINHHIKHYNFQDDLLYYKTLSNSTEYRLVIPKLKNLINKFIANAHSSLDAGKKVI